MYAANPLSPLGADVLYEWSLRLTPTAESRCPPMQTVRVQRGPDGQQVDAVRHRRRRRHLRGRRQRLRRRPLHRRGRRHRPGGLQQQAPGEPRVLQEDVGEPHAEEEVSHPPAQQAGSLGGESPKSF